MMSGTTAVTAGGGPSRRGAVLGLAALICHLGLPVRAQPDGRVLLTGRMGGAALRLALSAGPDARSLRLRLDLPRTRPPALILRWTHGDPSGIGQRLWGADRAA